MTGPFHLVPAPGVMAPKRAKKRKAQTARDDNSINKEVSGNVEEVSGNVGEPIVVVADVHMEDEVASEMDSDQGDTSRPQSRNSEVKSIAAEAVDVSQTQEESPKVNKKKPRIVSYIFSDEQEKSIGEWFKENECLYNRRHKQYKDSQHKRRLYEEKAASFTPPCTCKYSRKCYKLQLY